MLIGQPALHDRRCFVRLLNHILQNSVYFDEAQIMLYNRSINNGIVEGIDMSAAQESTQEVFDAKQVENVISFNVKILLTARGKTQTDLASYLGLQRSTISVKLKGKSEWSVPDLVNTANYLGTTPAALLDDSMMKTMSRMGTLQGSHNQGGITEPRYFLMPEPSGCPGCDSNARHLL